MKHVIDHETTARFHRGLGTTGKSVYIQTFEEATDSFREASRAVSCPVCRYDRCKVTVDHNPELGDDHEIRCNACGCELESAVDVAKRRAERSYR